MASRSKTPATPTRSRSARPQSSNPSRTLTVEDPLLTRAEVAEMLGVTEYWVKHALSHGYFAHVKVGKLVRVHRSDVLAYIAQQRKAR